MLNVSTEPGPVMAAHIDPDDRYNISAVKYAAQIHEARKNSMRKKAQNLNVEQLFQSPSERPGLGIALEYERMGNKPVTDDLQAQADDFSVEFEHLGITLGTVLHNVNLRKSKSPSFIQFIRQSLLERKVIFFRNQNLDEDEQVAFGKNFGALDAFPFGKPGANPFILEITHGKNNPGTENGWHTDVTWMEKPSLGSIAQCIEVPPFGGDTLFSDSHACYLGLPDELKKRIDTIWGINDYRIFIANRSILDDELIDSIKSEIPFGVNHPLVRTHPETKKNALYIHNGFLRHDSLYDERTNETLNKSESMSIVSALSKQHARPEYTCRFPWEKGSIAFWDNRAVQHYAASDYYPHRRVLRRVTVSGDAPFHNYSAS